MSYSRKGPCYGGFDQSHPLRRTCSCYCDPTFTHLNCLGYPFAFSLIDGDREDQSQTLPSPQFRSDSTFSCTSTPISSQHWVSTSGESWFCVSQSSCSGQLILEPQSYISPKNPKTGRLPTATLALRTVPCDPLKMFLILDPK